MTSWRDNIYSGAPALTSAQSSLSPTRFCRTFRFAGNATQTFVLPTGVQNLDAKLYIIANGSGATTDSMTVSAGGTNLITITSFGSASGVLRATTAGLGTLTTIASACADLSATAEVSAAVTLASVDQAAVYQLELTYSRLRSNTVGAP